jgi:O-antigen ligase
MLCGYTLARHLNWQRRFLLFVGAVYWLFAIQDARGFIAGARAQLGRAEQYAQTQGFDDLKVGSMYAGAFVYFAPLMLFLAIALFRLYPSLSKGWRLFVIAMQATFTIVAVLSGFGATTMMAFLAIILLAIYAPVKTVGWRLYYLGVSGSIYAAFELVRRGLLAQGGKGAAGEAFAKFTKLLSTFFSSAPADDVASSLEAASSLRSTLLLTSLDTFLRNPLMGHGFSGTEDTAVGGHSFLVDTAAIFGLVGLVPILAFFILLSFSLWRARAAGGPSWPPSSSTIFLYTLLTGLVMNPYFLSLLSLSYFLFLLLGFALADGDAAVRIRALATATPRRAPHRAFVSANEPIAPQ